MGILAAIVFAASFAAACGNDACVESAIGLCGTGVPDASLEAGSGAGGASADSGSHHAGGAGAQGDAAPSPTGNRDARADAAPDAGPEAAP